MHTMYAGGTRKRRKNIKLTVIGSGWRWLFFPSRTRTHLLRRAGAVPSRIILYYIYMPPWLLLSLISLARPRELSRFRYGRILCDATAAKINSCADGDFQSGFRGGYPRAVCRVVDTAFPSALPRPNRVIFFPIYLRPRYPFG